jgi:two-component system chemotaxis sensor kinase CheA
VDEEFREFLDIFREESLERMVNVSRSLEELSAGCDDPALPMEEIDRELHTIKGSSRLLGFEQLGQLVHEIEGLGRRYRDKGDVSLELLVEACDQLTTLVEQAADTGDDPAAPDLLARVVAALAAEGGAPAASKPTPGSASPPEPAPEPPAPVTEVDTWTQAADVESVPADTTSPTTRTRLAPETKTNFAKDSADEAPTPRSRRYALDDEHVRVRASRLQDLDGIVSDLSLTHLRLTSHEAELRRLLSDVDHGGTTPGGVSESLRLILQAYSGDSLAVRRSARTLQRLAVDVRLRPVEALFDHIPREARDVARRLGKLVRVRLFGGDTEIDRVILQRLKSPLSHLIRNAIDHGLEDVPVRVAAGKDAQGTLDVSAGHEGGQVLIRICDDGGGIDPQRIRRLAVERGVIEAGAAEDMTDEEALQLIFVAGFSTRKAASQISGRGVGMDVVRRVVEDMGGDVHVHGVPGEGTEVTIRLPLTQLISRVTFMRSQGQQFALSTESLVESLLLPKELVTTFAEREAVIFDGRSVPLVRLSALLGHRLLPDPPYLSVLVLRHGAELLALCIEELLEERSVVVKPLGWPLDNLQGMSGAVHLPTGEIAFLLHVPDLFAFSRSGRAYALPVDESNRRTILVVDDSIVSRQMVSRYVEALGLDLITAVDGLDAWGILERGVRPDLIVSDVEMPRLTGLGLARRVRSHELLGAVPIIIVSTRGSDADRQAGLEAGADAYLTKSELNEKSFRSLVERLM